MNDSLIILGGGATGLAAGFASGAKVFEAQQNPGGICSTYYLRTNSFESTLVRLKSEEDYRFEIGGGHWIFGGDQSVLSFIESHTPLKRYVRRSGVFFPKQGWNVPYPLQNNLGYLPDEIADKALEEMRNAHPGKSRTLEEWLFKSFGKTLSDLFFLPFHELYTAGLHKIIAPQDDYKSPLDMRKVEEGRHRKSTAVGYNVTFAYPQKGLGNLFASVSKDCRVAFGFRAVKIDTEKKIVFFENGEEKRYEILISTLPLNKMLSLTGIKVDVPSDPYSSVLVVNIGATKGQRYPEEHWLYVPGSKNKFHRVGFYSNVDASFLPKSLRDKNSHASLYVEKAYPGGYEPKQSEKEIVGKLIADELIEWGLIGNAEVIHSTWVDIAYTWSLPDSSWRTKALAVLQARNIFQMGRYGRWIFQGIADSIRDGFIVGSSFKKSTAN